MLDFFQRIKLAFKVMVAPQSVVPVLASQLITYDAEKKRLVITGDFEIHATGNLYLHSDQHVVVRSGNLGGDYTHGIWLNPDLEESDDIHIQSDQSGSSGLSDLQPDSGQPDADAHGTHEHDGSGSLCGSLDCSTGRSI